MQEERYKDTTTSVLTRKQPISKPSPSRIRTHLEANPSTQRSPWVSVVPTATTPISAQLSHRRGSVEVGRLFLLHVVSHVSESPASRGYRPSWLSQMSIHIFPPLLNNSRPFHEGSTFVRLSSRIAEVHREWLYVHLLSSHRYKIRKALIS